MIRFNDAAQLDAESQNHAHNSIKKVTTEESNAFEALAMCNIHVNTDTPAAGTCFR